MDLFTFILNVILVSASGAFSPGPLFFTTLFDRSISGVKSGLVLSTAHSLVELSLILFLTSGIISIFHEPITEFILGIISGVFLLAYGSFQIISFLKSRVDLHDDSAVKVGNIKNSFILGLVLTSLNPFFIVWWITIGSSLIFMALDFAALPGIAIMYLSHVWMDFFWLTIVAFFAKQSQSFINSKWYRYLMLLFGAILLFYGLFFLHHSINIRFGYL